MKVYVIDVSKKTDSFDSMYDKLEKIGNYLVYRGHIAIISDAKDINRKFEDEANIDIKEIIDVENEIDKEFVKDWVREEFAKREIEEAKKEIEERTTALYNIIVDAKKKLNELGGRIGDGNRKNIDEKETTTK
jgi:hypothetical protein